MAFLSDGGAGGLASGIATGTQLFNQVQARQQRQQLLDLQSKKFEQEIAQQAAGHKLKLDALKLKQKQAKDKKELEEKFFTAFGLSPQDAIGTATADPSIPASSPTPSLAPPPAPNGQLAGPGAPPQPQANIGPQPSAPFNVPPLGLPSLPQTPSPSLPQTPSAPRAAQPGQPRVVNEQELLQLRLLASQVGKEADLDFLIEQGAIVTPQSREEKERESQESLLDRRRARAEISRFEADTAQTAKVREREQRTIDFWRDKGLSDVDGTENGLAAFITARSGNLDKAAEIGFPNVKEAGNAYQALTRSGLSPLAATKALSQANRAPGLIALSEVATDSARTKEERKRALTQIKMVQSKAQERVTEVLPDGSMRIIEGGAKSPLPLGVQSKKLNAISAVQQGMIPMRRMIEVLEKNPSVASIPGTFRQLNLNLSSQLLALRNEGVQPEGPESTKLFKELLAGTADFSSFKTLTLLVAAGAAKAAGLADDGRMSDADLKLGKIAAGIPDSGWNPNTGAPAIINALKELMLIGNLKVQGLQTELGMPITPIDELNPSPQAILAHSSKPRVKKGGRPIVVDNPEVEAIDRRLKEIRSQLKKMGSP